MMAYLEVVDDDDDDDDDDDGDDDAHVRGYIQKFPK
jgi:hypothetical protein